jgi:DNA adenine methylase
LLNHLSVFFSRENTRYVEPFVGSASLFFKLMPREALLGDINPELMSTYKQIKNHPDDVFEHLKRYRKGKAAYLRLRSADLKDFSPVARAARFIYLNRFCFNGLYRTNMKGVFNVPYGGEKSGKLPTHDSLLSCSVALRKARLITGDFEKALGETKRGDFVYLDPPFSVLGKRVFTEYNPKGFFPKDITRLRGWLEKLHDAKISFLVSYAESDEAKALARGFHSKRINVRRNIAGFASNRVSTKEVLITNIGVS